MKHLRTAILALILVVGGVDNVWSQSHPSIFITAEEAADIRNARGQWPLLDAAVDRAVDMIDQAAATPMDVPPPGESGGYAHERHKQNYREMRNAGLLFQITGEERYAEFVRDMLVKYADMYPSLGPHPLAYNQKPGKLFHQTLNEEVWLVHTSIAYDCIYDWLSPKERSLFETNIFRPMAYWFSVRNKEEFNRIHNHGTWAVAAVGMIGYVMGDAELVEKSLYGTELDGKGGFLAQLDQLFSPDGYYMEGPYYIRYALMPFYYFAEAVQRSQPDFGIYDYRDQILKKALFSAVQTAFPNGVFPPINDASRTMDVGAPEVILAVDLAYARYGADDNLLGVANIQKSVILNGAGLKVARGLAQHEEVPSMDWESVEFVDGFDGKQGGLGILRSGHGLEQTMLLMKYGVHGQGHGHFDKLHFIYFDQGREVVPDYGFSRWVNIEPKYGGRYLPENKTYAMQTIAHNTVVVDKTSQNRLDRDSAEGMSGTRHFFSSGDGVQAMSARADGYYPGVSMQRTMLLVKHAPLGYPLVIDLYRLDSEESHQYDYPIHFRGQLVETNLDYDAHVDQLVPLGTEYGYQHIWEEARGQTDDGVRVSWVDGKRYYTLVTAAAPETQVLFGRTGANDPNFNLYSEPMVVVRNTDDEKLFAAVIEAHGFFSEARELSRDARGRVDAVHVIGHSAEASVVEIKGKEGWSWTVMVNNGPADAEARHRVTFDGRTFSWMGDFDVDFSAQDE